MSKNTRKLYINENKKLGKINEDIYGQFAEHLGRCIYEGIYVGENPEIPNVNGMRKDVVDALKELDVPILRWPGGCFADEYHWMDGIGPKENRPKRINKLWGGVVEDNSFGTHEFFELCEQIGCKTYINTNLGSGTVKEMADWVEYILQPDGSEMAELRKKNGRQEPWSIDYLGIGNESWGCGGHMTPGHYANEYRRYATFVKSPDWNKPIRKICSGPNHDDYVWTEGVLGTLFETKGNNVGYDQVVEWMGGLLSGLALHYYVYPDSEFQKGSATQFDDKSWYRTLKKALYTEELIIKHSAIMDQYDPNKKIGLMVDEWGIWSDAEPGTNPFYLFQQSTMRDALAAGITLNIFNKHCDRVHMANIAQMVNVVQAMILTEGSKMLLTPTYHVFKMYKKHQNAELLESRLENIDTIGLEQENKVPELYESVSISDDGTVNITLNNLSLTDDINIDIEFDKISVKRVVGEVLTGAMNAYNTFENPNVLQPTLFDDLIISDNGLSVKIPKCSVVQISVEN